MTNLDPTDSRPRPMIAILDAKPGMTDAFRELIIELGIRFRDEPGCLTFSFYEARDVEGRFYILEIYANERAFREHLDTAHVKHFIERLPSVSQAVRTRIFFSSTRSSFHRT